MNLTSMSGSLGLAGALLAIIGVIAIMGAVGWMRWRRRCQIRKIQDDVLRDNFERKLLDRSQ